MPLLSAELVKSLSMPLLALLLDLAREVFVKAIGDWAMVEAILIEFPYCLLAVRKSAKALATQ